MPAAQGRGGSGLRPGGAGQAARPGAVQRRDRRPLQVAVPQGPRRRLHRRRQARQQRRQGLPGRRHQRPRRLGRDPEARAGRDPGRLRARRGRRPLQRDAAGRGLELAPRDDLHAPGARPPRAASTSSASAASPAAPPARRPAWCSTSSTRRRPTTRTSSPSTACSTATSTAAARSSSAPSAAAAAAGSASRSGSSPSPATPTRRLQVLERELWRIAVENLDHPEQHVWAALAGARVNPSGWRRAKAMLQHDSTKELRRRFLLTCVQRNRNSQLRLKALAEIAPASRPRGLRRRDRHRRHLDPRRPPRRHPRPARGARRAPHRPPRPGPGLGLAARRLHARPPRGVRGAALARDQAPARAARQLFRPGPRAQRPPPGPRRRATRTAASRPPLLAAAVAHTPEGEEVLRGARMRAARKPSGVARELLRNFPKSGGSRRRRRKRKGGGGGNGERRQRLPGRQRRRAQSQNGADAQRLRQGRLQAEARSESRSASPRPASPRPRPPTPPTTSSARSALHREVDLAGAESALLAVPSIRTVLVHQQVARVVDPGRGARAPVPRDPPARQGVARPEAVEDRRRLRRRPSGPALRRAPPWPRRAFGVAPSTSIASEVAVSRRSSGRSPVPTVRFRPTPITAQPPPPRWKRDSISTPASLRLPDPDVVGPLDPALDPGTAPASDSAASQTASGTASGSSGRSPSGRSSAE